MKACAEWQVKRNFWPTQEEIMRKEDKIVTVDEFIWKIIAAYHECVYCEGFSNKKDERKFFEAARNIIQDTFS